MGSGADVRLGPTLAAGSSALLETEGVYVADWVSEVGVTRLTVSLELSWGGRLSFVAGDTEICGSFKRDQHGDEGRR